MNRLPKQILSSTYGKLFSRKLKRKKISIKTLKVYYDTDSVKEEK